jgi:uncharacterized membrane protein
MKDARRRSIAKALTWRVIATTTTMALAYAATGDLKLAGTIGALDVVIKLAFYYAHERAWGRVQWGKGTRLQFYQFQESPPGRSRRFGTKFRNSHCIPLLIFDTRDNSASHARRSGFF